MPGEPRLQSEMTDAECLSGAREMEGRMESPLSTRTSWLVSRVRCPVSPSVPSMVTILSLVRILLRQHHIYCRGYKQKTGELGQKLYKCWRYKSQYKRRIIEFIVWIFPEEQSIIWRGLPEYSVLLENECLFIIL